MPAARFWDNNELNVYRLSSLVKTSRLRRIAVMSISAAENGRHMRILMHRTIAHMGFGNDKHARRLSRRRRRDDETVCSPAFEIVDSNRPSRLIRLQLPDSCGG